MTLWLVTGINVGLAIANVVIALFNLRIFRAHGRYLQSQIEFYTFNTPAKPPDQKIYRHEHWGRQ